MCLNIDQLYTVIHSIICELIRKTSFLLLLTDLKISKVSWTCVVTVDLCYLNDMSVEVDLIIFYKFLNCWTFCGGSPNYEKYYHKKRNELEKFCDIV